MANIFYAWTDTLVPYTRARSGTIDSHLQAIEYGFDQVQQRFELNDPHINVIKGTANGTANINLGGFRLVNGADAVDDGDFVTRRQLMSTAFQAVLTAGPDGTQPVSWGGNVSWAYATPAANLALISMGVI